MAWVKHPAFLPSFIAEPATLSLAALATNAINMSGAGVVYEDSVDTSDYMISVDMHYQIEVFQTFDVGLIGRVNSSGDFYYGLMQVRQASGQFLSSLYKYIDSTQTFTFLTSTVNGFAKHTAGTTLNLKFLLKGNLLSLLADDFALTSVIDSSIVSGSPGIGASLGVLSGGSAGNKNPQFANFLVREAL